MTKQKTNKQKSSKPSTSTSTNTFYLVGVLTIGLIAVYALFGGNASTGPADAISAETWALGETVYQTQCASCHGENLEGEANWQSSNPDGTMKSPPHDETGHTWHHGDGYLVSRIRYGTTQLNDPLMQERSNMPAFDDLLTDEEIDAVLAYIKSEWPADIQVIQAERTAAEQP